MTWAKVRHLTDWATQVPHFFLFSVSDTVIMIFWPFYVFESESLLFLALISDWCCQQPCRMRPDRGHTTLLQNLKLPSHREVSTESKYGVTISLSLSLSLSLVIFWERERERERERKREWGRGRERGRERIPSRLHTLPAWSLMWGLNPRTVRSWPELRPRVRHSIDWATQAPQNYVISELEFL